MTVLCGILLFCYEFKLLAEKNIKSCHLGDGFVGK